MMILTASEESNNLETAKRHHRKICHCSNITWFIILYNYSNLLVKHKSKFAIRRLTQEVIETNNNTNNSCIFNYFRLWLSSSQLCSPPKLCTFPAIMLHTISSKDSNMNLCKNLANLLQYYPASLSCVFCLHFNQRWD